MEEITELIRRYNLEEDKEHVIIPYTDRNGRKKRIYLLKRRFIRVVYRDENFIDYPLNEVIEATVRYPDLLLSEAIYLMQKNAEDKQTGTT